MTNQIIYESIYLLNKHAKTLTQARTKKWKTREGIKARLYPLHKEGGTGTGTDKGQDEDRAGLHDELKDLAFDIDNLSDEIEELYLLKNRALEKLEANKDLKVLGYHVFGNSPNMKYGRAGGFGYHYPGSLKGLKNLGKIDEEIKNSYNQIDLGVEEAKSIIKGFLL